MISADADDFTRWDREEERARGAPEGRSRADDAEEVAAQGRHLEPFG
ncbi:hypothetical protein [Nocardia iowensis]|uniref:Uncharacterized protein n=1 Tax=Nocardia iowensis TaxID=204891 RepID=A0ABX8RQP1_NOCIO|nr:hypothetical protein [Nocardia iowensis]QXN91953.1 hypothetical protein KV110_01810 [Nocardia iowensis]